jgi:hypothetical protein
MNRLLLFLSILIFACFNIRCVPTQKFVLEEPQTNKSMVIGAILVENIGLEDVYEAKKANIVVTIVGKSIEAGKESTEGYRVKTNPDGYYMIPNVPPGSYVIKGIELDLGYETHLIIGSYWDSNLQIYRPEQFMIDQIVKVWPAMSNDRIINLNIRYFKIDAAQRIAYDTFKRIDSASVSLPQIRHTMPNPIDYFKVQYPASNWFQEAQ